MDSAFCLVSGSPSQGCEVTPAKERPDGGQVRETVNLPLMDTLQGQQLGQVLDAAPSDARSHFHGPDPTSTVQSAEGEAKFWMEPRIELEANFGLPSRQIGRILKLLEERKDEIRQAWRRHLSR